jgi:hypothetical protein
MKYTTDNKKMTAVLDDIKDLDKLLTERIADLHEIKGMMQARHAYVLYRERLWGIKESLLSALTEVPEKPKKP